ncbi:MAG: carbohydrate ABC transporter permease [Chloroflexi bacterium]|nr:carbohydrate ABC transporter permease [Chloroflexota bacterium]
MLQTLSGEKLARPSRAKWLRRTQLRSLAVSLRLIALAAGALVIMAPIIWMLAASLEPMSEVTTFPPALLPHPVQFSNYIRGFTFMPFARFFLNTLFIGFMSALGTLLAASLAGYAFARLSAPDKNVLFILVLSTLMLPYTVTVIPQYILFRQLHWINTFFPLWVPEWFGGGPFFIFLFRQFFMSIPSDVFEAARIDGCGYFGLYRQILLPLSVPVLATAAIFRFQFAWNDFLGPLIYINSTSKYTVSLGLSLFTAKYGATPWNQLLAVTILAIIPPVVLFFIGQRYLITGIVVVQK